MNKKSRYLVFALIALCVSIPHSLLAAKKVNYTDEDLEEEQRVIESYVRDAESDLKYAQENYGRHMINSAWWYVTESGIKIDQARVLMKTHPQRIERCIIGFFESEKTERKKLRDGHARLKQKIDKANGLLKAVEKDVGSDLGIDVGTFRDTLAILKILCEKGYGDQYCNYFNQLKGLIVAGKIEEAIDVMNKAADDINNAFEEHPELREELPSDVQLPTGNETSTGTKSANTSTSNAPATTTPAVPVVTPITQTDSANTPKQLSDQEIEKLYSESQEVRNGLEEIYNKTNDPRVLALLNELNEAIASKDIARIQEVMNKISQEMGELQKTESGEIIFILPDQKTIAPGYIAGKYGEQLRIEKIYKLVDSPETPGEYKAQLVDTVEWQFVVVPQMVSSESESNTYSLTLKDNKKHTNFTVTSWKVYDSENNEISTGSGNPLEVTFTGNGEFRIIVEGATEHGSKGSPFKMKKIIRL